MHRFPALHHSPSSEYLEDYSQCGLSCICAWQVYTDISERLVMMMLSMHGGQA